MSSIQTYKTTKKNSFHRNCHLQFRLSITKKKVIDHTVLPSLAKFFFGKEESSKQRMASKKKPKLQPKMSFAFRSGSKTYLNLFFNHRDMTHINYPKQVWQLLLGTPCKDDQLFYE
jgi:hypothetical protein